MARNEIHARRSQLVTTYGVGGLFPAENSSFLIAGLHLWDRKELPTVVEPRLRRQLRVSEFKAPPATPDRGRGAGVPVTRFPEFLQCPACSALGTVRQLRASSDKPVCGVCDAKAELMPSRFVTACIAGHLSDFPYFDWVHPRGDFPPKGWKYDEYPAQGTSSRDASAHVLRLRSSGRTSSLADLVVSCSCGRSRDLDKAFGSGAMRSFACAGDRPWLGSTHRQKLCDEERVTVQRGASNVWFGSSASAISIPPYSGRVTAIVHRTGQLLRTLSREELRDAAETGNGQLVNSISEAHHVDARELARQALDTYFDDASPALSDEDFRLQEYKALLEGHKGDTHDPDSQFVSRPAVVAPEASDWVTAVRRVTRLREVRALRGFTRLTAAEQMSTEGGEALAPLRPEDDPETWLPAIEMLGEGLFIALDRERLENWAQTPLARDHQRTLTLNRARAAARRRAMSGDRSAEVPPTPEVDIVRVTVHTLAHVLIDQLALDAGYPASSLRERLFVGKDMAGILVYTASTDSAGSLGGVASMAAPDRLGPALEEALARLAWCSADPVCIESTGSGTDGANLAACHNCVLLPETSCEEFNTGLDRGVVFGTPDVQDGGVVSWLQSHPSSLPRVDAGFPVSTGSGTSEVPEAVRDRGWDTTWSDSTGLRAVVEALAVEDVPQPTVGEEIGRAQIVADLVWEPQKVAVIVDLSEENEDELVEDGWDVLPVQEEFDVNEIVDWVVDSLESTR